MSRNIYSSVEQCCFTKCMQTTPHTLYSECRVCGNINQEKKSPADYEREREITKYAQKLKKQEEDWGMGI